MKKLGIMGGTFNPVHNAHLLIAETAREQYGLERVIFVTDGNPPHKHSDISAEKRFYMTHIAISSNEYFEDDNFEVKKTEKSYSVHMLEYLKKKYPDYELFFIIGEDSLRDLPSWYMPEKLLEMCTLLVFPRTSVKSLEAAISDMNKKFGKIILPIASPVIQISSTAVRKRIEQGKSVRYMVPDAVIEYIKENRLYEK